jgi:hypothetical protein
MWGRVLVSIVVVALAGCGEETTDTRGATSPETSAQATSTTAAATTPPSSTVPEVVTSFSREALLAIRRCLDQPSLSLPYSVFLDGPSVLEEPIALCKEALVQARVDYDSNDGPDLDLIDNLTSYVGLLDEVSTAATDDLSSFEPGSFSDRFVSYWQPINYNYALITGAT